MFLPSKLVYQISSGLALLDVLEEVVVDVRQLTLGAESRVSRRRVVDDEMSPMLVWVESVGGEALRPAASRV